MKKIILLLCLLAIASAVSARDEISLYVRSFYIEKTDDGTYKLHTQVVAEGVKKKSKVKEISISFMCVNGERRSQPQSFNYHWILLDLSKYPYAHLDVENPQEKNGELIYDFETPYILTDREAKEINWVGVTSLGMSYSHDFKRYIDNKEGQFYLVDKSYISIAYSPNADKEFKRIADSIRGTSSELKPVYTIIDEGEIIVECEYLAKDFQRDGINYYGFWPKVRVWNFSDRPRTGLIICLDGIPYSTIDPISGNTRRPDIFIGSDVAEKVEIIVDGRRYTEAQVLCNKELASKGKWIRHKEYDITKGWQVISNGLRTTDSILDKGEYAEYDGYYSLERQDLPLFLIADISGMNIHVKEIRFYTHDGKGSDGVWRFGDSQNKYKTVKNNWYAKLIYQYDKDSKAKTELAEATAKGLKAYDGTYQMSGKCSKWGEGIAQYFYRDAPRSASSSRIYEGSFTFKARSSTIKGQFKNDKMIGRWEWNVPNFEKEKEYDHEMEKEATFNFNDNGQLNGDFIYYSRLWGAHVRRVGFTYVVKGRFEKGRLVSIEYSGDDNVYADGKYNYRGDPVGVWEISGENVPNKSIKIKYDNNGNVIEAFYEDPRTGDRHFISNNWIEYPRKIRKQELGWIQGFLYRSTPSPEK